MSLDPHAEPQAGQRVESRTIAPPEGQQRSLMDVWRVLTKQRFTIFTVTILSVAGAAWYAFRTPPIFESVSHVEIAAPEFGTTDLLNFYEEELGNTTQLQTEIQVLKSDSVLFETAKALNLMRQVSATTNKKGGSNESASSSGITPEERGAMIRLLRGGLSVALIPDTEIVELRFRGTDPKLAADIVNQLAETYADESLRSKYERTMHVSAWLQQRLQDLKQEASDHATATGGLSTDAQHRGDG